MLDIHALMRGLAEKRPVFHNEADFQFALASHIREECDQPVRLEWKPFPGGPTPVWIETTQPTSPLLDQATSGDYRRLTAHLETLRVSRLVATIPQLGGILRAKLPPSAKQDRKWWANVWKEPQAKSWMAAGWKTGKVKVVRKAVDAVEFRLRMSVDLWLPGLGVPIELKYRTREVECLMPSSDLDPPRERFSLADQGAQDHGRYDFLKDVERLERVVADHPDAGRGMAVLLTNDPLYWRAPDPKKPKTYDESFRVHEQHGREPDRTPRYLRGTMAWANGVGGAKNGRECRIVLNGSYPTMWKCYSVLNGDREARNRTFRYLAVEVSRSSAGAAAGESPKNQPGCAPSP